jgi:hypothetical protein
MREISFRPSAAAAAYYQHTTFTLSHPALRIRKRQTRIDGQPDPGTRLAHTHTHNLASRDAKR